MAEEEKKEVKISLKLPKFNVWIISTVILAFVAIAIWFLKPGPTSLVVQVLPAEEAAKKAIDYINQNLVQAGTSASLVSVEDIGSVYQVITSYQGSQIPVYISKDGSMLFLSAFNTSESLVQTQTQAEFDAPDKEKPEVKLFVMSFCPYGVQAENLMKPVFDLLGTKADIKIHFIVNVNGNTIDSVDSLHGANEAKEDARQVCIMKYYTQKTYWDYLMEFNKNCYSLYRDDKKLDECWKQTAQKFGIDIDKIETCAYSSEGVELLKADEQLTNQYGVTGSPTLIINGARYTGTRSSEAFKNAICSGFVTKPSECSQNITSSSSSSPSGQC